MKEKQSPAVGEQGSAQARAPVSGARRILVAEDDASIRQLSTAVLMHQGYQVDGAEDGEEAWNTLQNSSYDLLITDNAMPKVTGVELLQKLHAAHMALPAIMATGTLPAADEIPYPWLAAVLVKPFSIDELLGTVRLALHADEGTGQQFDPPWNPQSQRPSNGTWS